MLSLNSTIGSFDRLVLVVNANPPSTIYAGAVISGSGTGQDSISTDNCNLDEWSHVAGVYQTANKQSFLNGVASTVNTASYTPANISRLVIGARLSTTYGFPFNGDIAEVGIWSAALTAAEIASLSAGFTPDQVRPQSLVFYAPLVRELRDLRGGLTITATNGPTVADHPRIIQ
jgi:hypothetical protein